MLNRRNFIKAGAAAVCYNGFLLVSPRTAASRAPHSLTASVGEILFEGDQENAIRVMFYNQSIPGPLISIPQGRESVIHFHNRLDEPSTVHWRGLRIDNAMDGVTQAPVLPGESFEYRLDPPDAGTCWYHSHLRLWYQLALGLAGVMIVEERNSSPTTPENG